MEDPQDKKEKARGLAERIEGLSESLDRSDELLSEGDGVLEKAEQISDSPVSLKPTGGGGGGGGVLHEEGSYADIMNLATMTDDFRFVRDTLKEVTENARRVQGSITLELLESEGEKRSSLVMSFSELSKAITDAQKLYVQSYKEMSNTLLNLDKIKQNSDRAGADPSQHLHIHSRENISTVDLINRLKGNDR